MSVSAFVVRVPAAESVVGDLRDQFDAAAKLGVPAHITILYPFMRPEEITPGVLRQAQEALSVVPSFIFSLNGIGRFPATTYLLPAPVDPFIALTTALVRGFPAFRPYGGEHREVVPHLTVAHGDPSVTRDSCGAGTGAAASRFAAGSNGVHFCGSARKFVWSLGGNARLRSPKRRCPLKFQPMLNPMSAATMRGKEIAHDGLGSAIEDCRGNPRQLNETRDYRCHQSTLKHASSPSHRSRRGSVLHSLRSGA